jgi:hypothetical protein
MNITTHRSYQSIKLKNIRDLCGKMSSSFEYVNILSVAQLGRDHSASFEDRKLSLLLFCKTTDILFYCV